MCFSVHVCICECHWVMLCSHISMDVCVCAALQKSMCAVRAFLSVFACLCVRGLTLWGCVSASGLFACVCAAHL